MPRRGASRRLLLTRALKFTSLLGALALAVPFFGFLVTTLAPAPGTDAPADAFTVPVSELLPGKVVERRWRGRPVWLYRPVTGAPVTVIHPFEDLRGCKVFHLPAGAAEAPAGWRGGFGEPCFGARFDGRGRRVPGTGDPAQRDLTGPPHHVDGEWLVVGHAE